MSLKKHAFFVGRWQSPNALHEGHIWCFEQKLKEGIPVLIGIRNVQKDEKNPHMAKEVEALIHLRLADYIEAGLVKTLILPCDIESIVYGREVGYKIEELVPPQEIAEISATKLREQKNASI